MRLPKVLILLILPLTLDIFIACCKDPDGILLGYLGHNALSVSNIDNSGPEIVLTEASAVRKAAYGIRIKLKVDVEELPKTASISFMNTAFATSCAQGNPPYDYYIWRQNLVQFQILTQNDFDPMHPAQSDVSSAFMFFTRENFTPISEFDNYGEFSDSTDVLSFLFSSVADSIHQISPNELELHINTLLMTPPTVSGSHQFEVKLTLSDGRILAAKTNVIDLRE